VQQSPTAPWKDELDNCNHFLKLDQRNFHCWDYRRYIVQHSTHPSAEAEAEFAYTLAKISENFSNYSAWHYRTTLLPKVRPAVGEDAGVNAVAHDTLVEEFETVASAFYIDPCDQSAWIYHRWLLGREETAPTLCAVHSAEANAAITLVFSHPVLFDPAAAAVCSSDGDAVEVAWTAENGTAHGNDGSSVPSVVWAARPLTPGGIVGRPSIKLADGAARSASKIVATPVEMTAPSPGKGVYCVEGGPLLHRLAKYRLPAVELLQEQLEMCMDLMTELDEGVEKKWALLASVYILCVHPPLSFFASALTACSIGRATHVNLQHAAKATTARFVVSQHAGADMRPAPSTRGTWTRWL
jgi:hypothetical protein